MSEIIKPDDNRFEYSRVCLMREAGEARQCSQSAKTGEQIAMNIEAHLDILNKEHAKLKDALVNAQEIVKQTALNLEDRDNELVAAQRQANIACLLLGRTLVEEVLSDPVALVEAQR